MRLSCSLFLILFATALTAQSYLTRIHNRVHFGDTLQLHQLILLDYTKLLGRAEDIQQDTLLFKLRGAADASRIPAEEIRFLGVYSPNAPVGVTYSKDSSRVIVRTRLPKDPVYDFQDLTYVQTALPFAFGGQYKNTNAFYNRVEWNGRNFGGGVGTLAPVLLTANLKVRFSVAPKFHLGLANEIGVSLFESVFDDPLLLGDLRAIATIGDSHHFFNIASGPFYQLNSGTPTVFLHRLGIGGSFGTRWTLYGELGVFRDNNERFSTPRRALSIIPTFTAALRTRRHRWNFGLLGVLTDINDIFVAPIPYLGYQKMWGVPPAVRSRSRRR